MKKSDAIAYFGKRIALARAAYVSPAAVTQWGELVPLGTAALLEKLTGGKLKLNPADYRKRQPPPPRTTPHEADRILR